MPPPKVARSWWPSPTPDPASRPTRSLVCSSASTAGASPGRKTAGVSAWPSPRRSSSTMAARCRSRAPRAAAPPSAFGSRSAPDARPFGGPPVFVYHREAIGRYNRTKPTSEGHADGPDEGVRRALLPGRFARSQDHATGGTGRNGRRRLHVLSARTLRGCEASGRYRRRDQRDPDVRHARTRAGRVEHHQVHPRDRRRQQGLEDVVRARDLTLVAGAPGRRGPARLPSLGDASVGQYATRQDYLVVGSADDQA